MRLDLLWLCSSRCQPNWCTATMIPTPGLMSGRKVGGAFINEWNAVGGARLRLSPASRLPRGDSVGSRDTTWISGTRRWKPPRERPFIFVCFNDYYLFLIWNYGAADTHFATGEFLIPKRSGRWPGSGALALFRLLLLLLHHHRNNNNNTRHDRIIMAPLRLAGWSGILKDDPVQASKARQKIHSFLSPCRRTDGGWRATFSLMRFGRALREELFVHFYFWRTGTLRFRWLHTRGSQPIYTARIYMHQFTESSLPDRKLV